MLSTMTAKPVDATNHHRISVLGEKVLGGGHISRDEASWLFNLETSADILDLLSWANRATMVPDLHSLKTPTNDEFWRTWIAHGKAGTLMPAFSTAEGGPLTDMQIATIAAYLNMIIPSQPIPAVTNAPTAN